MTCSEKMSLIIGLLLFLLHLTVGKYLERRGNDCTTPGCKKAADFITFSLDKSVDPCVDFYQYACGNFLKKTVIPADKASYGAIDAVTDNLNIHVRDVLERNKNMSFKPFALVSNFYKSCMNTVASDRAKALPLLNKLVELIGGWPLIQGNKWNRRKFNLMNSLVNLHFYGEKYIFAFGITNDYMNNTRKIPTIMQPDLGLHRELLLGENFAEQRDEYRNLGFAIVKAMTGSEPAQWQIRDIKDIIDFEIKLANVSVPDKDRVDVVKMFVKQKYENVLKKLKHVFNFKCFTDKLLKSYEVITDSEEIVQSDTSYFLALGDILKHTPARVLANYLGWRFALSTISFLSPSLFKEANKINLKMHGISSEPERWKTCSLDTTDSLELAVGKLYVDDYFNEESKKELLDIVTVIEDSFKSIIQDIDWMDEKTKAKALKKLAAISIGVGYPDSYNDSSELEKEYEGLNLTPDSYFNNKLNIDSYETKKSLRRRKIQDDPKRWPKSPASFNAFYNPLNNSVILLAGFLQSPVYDIDSPRAVNYGRIGSFVGHEFTHGFDNTGKSFDEHGNLLNWWTDSVLKKFNEKVQCFIDEYEKFYMPEINMHVNGIVTAGENVADSGGVRESYLAYIKSLETEDDYLLPNVDLDSKQLFFVSYATLWCNEEKNESLRNTVLSDPHSPNKFRVNGPLSNMPEFWKAFNCSKSSPMVHDPPCKVW